MSVPHTVLGLLDLRPRHGYALREALQGFAWMYPMAHASIYPTLRELEGRGWVRHVEQVHGGRLRKIYSVTDAGRRELARWLADADEPRGVVRDPVLLRIGLMRPGATREALAWIRREHQRAGDAADRADALLKERGTRLPTYSRMLAEHGRDLARQRAEWLGRVAAEMAAEDGDGADPASAEG